MYFFQDDIGLLVQHAQYNFWEFLIFPQAEHFAPLLHALTYFEFKLFYLNFYGYFFVSLFLHLINVFILYKILKLLRLSKKSSVIISLLFLINLTFVEPLLWFSAQGVVLSNIFIGLSFYFWLKKSPLIYITFISASFSYSTGLGLGIIFAFFSLLANKFNLYFLLFGISSFVIPPLVAGSQLAQVTPVINNPSIDFLLFLAFVIAGVGRGVFARLFFPGFEPRHFEILKTLISFLPFAAISAFTFKIIITVSKKISHLLISIVVLIFYPYIWAGIIRFHFGIKQALSERYAYTPLFFSIILLGILLKYFFAKKIKLRNKFLAFAVFVILILQSFNFYKKAVEFEIKPLLTKKYIEYLSTNSNSDKYLNNAPLPDYINQPLKNSDLIPLLTK